MEEMKVVLEAIEEYEDELEAKEAEARDEMYTDFANEPVPGDHREEIIRRLCQFGSLLTIPEYIEIYRWSEELCGSKHRSTTPPLYAVACLLIKECQEGREGSEQHHRVVLDLFPTSIYAASKLAASFIGEKGFFESSAVICVHVSDASDRFCFIDLDESFQLPDPETFDEAISYVRSSTIVFGHDTIGRSNGDRFISPCLTQVNGSVYEEVILSVCQELADGAVAIFPVDRDFFEPESSYFLAMLNSIGVKPRLVLEDGKDLHAFFTRDTSCDVSVGALPREDISSFLMAIISEQGKTHNLTRKTSLEDFQTFSEIQYDEKIRSEAKKLGLKPYKATEVILRVEEVDKKNEDNSIASSINESSSLYCINQDLFDRRRVFVKDLPEDTWSVRRLIINSELISPELFASFHDSKFGDLQEEVIRDYLAMFESNKSRAEKVLLYLPDLPNPLLEKEALELESSIQKIATELEQIRSQKFRNPLEAQRLLKSCKSIGRNSEEMFLDWVESLPFPLASILWNAHSANEHKDKLSGLLQFFEAFSAFHATVLLSAFSKKVDEWPALQEQILNTMQRAKLSIENASFGTWNVINGTLSKYLRTKLKKFKNAEDNAAFLFRHLKTCRKPIATMLSDSEIITVIQDASKLRNDVAHYRLVSNKQIKEGLGKAEDLLQRIRGSVGTKWADFKLLDPCMMQFRRGEYEANCRVIMGTRTPFQIAPVVTTKPMENGFLYLYSSNESEALQLLPFIQMMKPENEENNICYFYSKLEASGMHMQTFHHDSAPVLITDKSTKVIRSVFGID